MTEDSQHIWKVEIAILKIVSYRVEVILSEISSQTWEWQCNKPATLFVISMWALDVLSTFLFAT